MHPPLDRRGRGWCTTRNAHNKSPWATAWGLFLCLTGQLAANWAGAAAYRPAGACGLVPGFFFATHGVAFSQGSALPTASFLKKAGPKLYSPPAWSAAHFIDLHPIAGELHGAVQIRLLPGEQLHRGAVIGALHLAGVLLGVHRHDDGLRRALAHEDPLLVPQGQVLEAPVL